MESFTKNLQPPWSGYRAQMNTVCTTYVRPLTVSCDHLEVVVELVVSGQPLGQRCSSFRGDVAHLVQENLSFPLFVYLFVCMPPRLCCSPCARRLIFLFVCLFLCLFFCLPPRWCCSPCARRFIFSCVCMFVAHLTMPEDLSFLLFVFKPTLLPFLALSLRYLSSLRSQQSTLARITWDFPDYTGWKWHRKG